MLRSPWRDARWVVRSAALWLPVIKQKTPQQNQPDPNQPVTLDSSVFSCRIIRQVRKKELLFEVNMYQKRFIIVKSYWNANEPVKPLHVVFFGFLFYSFASDSSLNSIQSSLLSICNAASINSDSKLCLVPCNLFKIFSCCSYLITVFYHDPGSLEPVTQY